MRKIVAFIVQKVLFESNFEQKRTKAAAAVRVSFH